MHACGFNVCEWHLPETQTKDWWDDQFDFRTAWEQRIGGVRDAFDERVLVVANHSPQPYSEDVLTWMETQPGVTAQMNALKADTNPSWEGYEFIRDFETTTGWQFIGPSLGADGQPVDRFGGEFQDAVQLGLQSQPAYFEFYQLDIELLNQWERCDWNGDGTCSTDDIDALILQQIAQSMGAVTDRVLDLDADGLIRTSDRDVWLNSSGFAAGDADLDGDVDGLDFLAWSARRFLDADPIQPWQHGDWTGDGIVDANDYILWNTNNTTTATIAQVPEPASWLWLAMHVLLMVGARFSSPPSVARCMTATSS